MKPRLLPLATIIFLTLVLCELTARVIDVSVFTKGSRIFDAELGWRLAQDQENYSFNHERTVLHRFNRLGFRDINFPEKPSPAIRRIAVIGDSYTESMQVNREQTFTTLLAQKLNQKAILQRWEVLNFGVGDFGTLQEEMVLEREVWKFHPDIVILQTFPLNDIYNNSISGFGISSPQDEFRPYPNPETKYQTVTFAHPARAFFRTQSRFFRLIEVSLQNLGIIENSRTQEYSDHRGQMLVLKHGLSRSENRNPDINLNILAENPQQIPEVQQGWEATEVVLKRIVDSCRNKNVPLIVINLPHSVQFEHAALKSNLPFTYHPTYAENRIAKFLEPFGVRSIPLVDLFAQNKARVLPEIEGHLNEFGHELVAQQLFEAVSFLPPALRRTD